MHPRPRQSSRNSRACRDSHLDHHESQKSFHGVRADIHPRGNFLTCESLKKVPNGLAFALSKTESFHEFSAVESTRRGPLEKDCKSWTQLRIAISIGINLKRLADITALTGLEFADKNSPLSMVRIDKSRADPLSEENFWLLNAASVGGEKKYLECRLV